MKFNNLRVRHLFARSSRPSKAFVLLGFCGASIALLMGAHAQKSGPSSSPTLGPAKATSSSAKPPQLKVLHESRDVIWGFDFLSDNEIVLTERKGELKILRLDASLPQASRVVRVQGAPKVWAKGQGGLLDVRVHPEKKNWIYLTFSAPLAKGGATALGLGRIEREANGARLVEWRELFRSDAGGTSGVHFGSRIEFRREGNAWWLYMSIGDRDERDLAQSLKAHNGKILRLNLEGRAGADNPFVGQSQAHAEVWSLGHRSPQGLARNPTTDELWMAEMGPRGGDELNLVKRGANYGWPKLTYGREYWGPSIGEGTTQAGFEPPVAHWVPSISPSGMAWVSSDKIPAWKGSLLMGTLSGTHIRRLVLKGSQVSQQEVLFADQGQRFRALREGPDGWMYFATDAGLLGRIE